MGVILHLFFLVVYVKLDNNNYFLNYYYIIIMCIVCAYTLKTEMSNVNLKGPRSDHSFKMSDCFF